MSIEGSSFTMVRARRIFAIVWALTTWACVVPPSDCQMVYHEPMCTEVSICNQAGAWKTPSLAPHSSTQKIVTAYKDLAWWYQVFFSITESAILRTCSESRWQSWRRAPNSQVLHASGKDCLLEWVRGQKSAWQDCSPSKPLDCAPYTPDELESEFWPCHPPLDNPNLQSAVDSAATGLTAFRTLLTRGCKIPNGLADRCQQLGQLCVHANLAPRYRELANTIKSTLDLLDRELRTQDYQNESVRSRVVGCMSYERQRIATTDENSLIEYLDLLDEIRTRWCTDSSAPSYLQGIMAPLGK